MSAWAQAFEHMMSLPPGLPEWSIAVIALVCAYAMVVIPSGAVMAFLERKLSADFQARVGPNRSGPAGLFQPVADLLKLLQKGPGQAQSWREELWMGVHTMALYSTVAVLPLGSAVLLVDTDMSAFLPFWAALVLALGTMLLGLNQGSVSGWFGGTRIASQAMAASFPALIAILTAGLPAGGFRWSQLAAAQGSSPFHWTVFSSPFQFIAFLVFVASGLVLLSVPPLDGGISLTDLHGGVSAHLAGRRLSLFRLGRFYGFFLWSIISVTLFLGAWNIPRGMGGALRDHESWLALALLELFVVLVKAFGLMLLVVWVARANPRSRVDHITDFSWKVLSPFSLAALAGTALWTVWMGAP
jgi:NADH-quinone oxidoreductase subunit H